MDLHTCSTYLRELHRRCSVKIIIIVMIIIIIFIRRIKVMINVMIMMLLFPLLLMMMTMTLILCDDLDGSKYIECGMMLVSKATDMT